MSPRSPFFGNSIIPLLTQVFALFLFNVLFCFFKKLHIDCNHFPNLNGDLNQTWCLVVFETFYALFSSSMMKLSVLIGNVCCNTDFFSFGHVTSGCPNRFGEWSFQFLMRSSVIFSLILTLFVSFIPVIRLLSPIRFYFSDDLQLLWFRPPFIEHSFIVLWNTLLLVVFWHHPVSLHCFWSSRD